MGKLLSTAHNRGQSLGEEVANSISHGLGLVAAIVGTPFLILSAIDYADVSFIVGVSIFSATMIILYLASTLYHAMPRGKTKYVFRVIDHSAVYLLIAGTYTPFMLGVLEGVWGGALLAAVSTTLYVVLGWLILIVIKPLVSLMEPNGLLLLVLGGVLYTLGVVFFVIDSRLRYGHFVWHLFVVGGTVCHYFSIFYYGA